MGIQTKVIIEKGTGKIVFYKNCETNEVYNLFKLLTEIHGEIFDIIERSPNKIDPYEIVQDSSYFQER